jgi:hypothetical protein
MLSDLWRHLADDWKQKKYWQPGDISHLQSQNGGERMQEGLSRTTRLAVYLRAIPAAVSFVGLKNCQLGFLFLYYLAERAPKYVI